MFLINCTELVIYTPPATAGQQHESEMKKWVKILVSWRAIPEISQMSFGQSTSGCRASSQGEMFKSWEFNYSRDTGPGGA